MKLATLHDFFCDPLDADRRLLLHEGRAYTKGDMARLIGRAAKAAMEMPGRECILRVQDNLRFAVGFFALLHSGKDIILASNVRENTLDALGVRNVLTDISLDLDGGGGGVAISPFPPKEVNVAFFTSGSTGEPKRIAKTFHRLYLELDSIEELLSPAVRDNTVALATVTMFHHYGLTFALMYSMARGFLIDAALIETPEDLARRLGRHENAFLITSPSFLDRLGRHRDIYDFPSKPYLAVCSGAPLSAEGAGAAGDMLGVLPLEIFGSTETGAVASRRQLENAAWTLVPHAKAHAAPDGRLAVTSDFAAEAECVLGDAVEFLDAGHFVLKGRIDRMVKIEGKRVSLPETEAALGSHGFVRSAHCLPVKNRNERTVVGACVCLGQEGREMLLESGRKKTVDLLKAHMAQRTDKVAIPLKWRFVDEIPVNTQSKVMPAEVGAIMLSDVAEPVVLKKTVSGDAAELEIAFLPESAYFDGHFPKRAILPGVVQVHFAAHFSDRIWRTGAEFREIRKLRFKKIMGPLQKLRLGLTRSGREVAFEYRDGAGAVCSTGTIAYA